MEIVHTNGKSPVRPLPVARNGTQTDARGSRVMGEIEVVTTLTWKDVDGGLLT